MNDHIARAEAPDKGGSCCPGDGCGACDVTPFPDFTYPTVTEQVQAKARTADFGDNPAAVGVASLPYAGLPEHWGEVKGSAADKPVEQYDPSEQDELLNVFLWMLRDATKDGGRKRAAGTKPPWWRDDAHEAAIFSHINKWKHGELRDPDSGAHPLVNGAWRMLAIAYKERFGRRDPREVAEFEELFS